jgi:hypothetical protein
MKIEINASDVNGVTVVYRSDLEFFQATIYLNKASGMNSYIVYFENKEEAIELVSGLLDLNSSKSFTIEPEQLRAPPPLEIKTVGG